MRLRRHRDDVTTDEATLTARGAGFSVQVADVALLDGAADLVRWLRAQEPGFTAGHYGFLPVRIGDDGVVRDADEAIAAHDAQEQVCWDLASEFEPPRASASAVVAPGALDRERLTATRYEYMRPQSGWFVGGEAGERMTLGEVVARRPELLDFLALEPGWSVTLEPGGARVKRRP